MAAKLECEICGGKLIGKPGGIFECDSCGMEYSTEWAKAKIQEIRGTVKVEGTVEVTGKVQVEGAATKESLLKRAEMCCAEKNWKKATELSEQVLNIDPVCGEAYLIAAMAEKGFDTRAKLHERCVNATLPLPQGKNMKRAQEFLPELFAQWHAEKERNYEAYRTKYDTDAVRIRPLYAKAAGLLRSNIYGVFGLRTDGTVLAAGLNPENTAIIQQWSEITSIASGCYHVVGLRADGTVVAWGSDSGRRYGQCDVETWRNITAIACGYESTFGLRADGTVVATGNNEYGQCNVKDWTDIAAVTAGKYHTIGLRRNGTVVAAGDNEYGQCNVEEWDNITAIAVSGTHTVGLKRDGTMVAAGQDYKGACDVEYCENVYAIAAANRITAALRKDGTVIDTMRELAEISEQWTDVVTLTFAEDHILALRKDGTVLSTNGVIQAATAEWHDIVSALYDSSIREAVHGLRRDGTVMTTNQHGFSEQISNWRLFNSIDTLEQERAEGLSRMKAACIAREKAETERRAQKRAELLAEQKDLQTELSQLKGLFSGKRRKEIELLLTVNRYALQELEEQS